MLKNMKQITFVLLLLSLVGAGLLVVALLYFEGGPGLPNYSKEEQAWLRSHNEDIEVLFGYQAPPNAFSDDDGHYVGMMVDYFHEIERNMGVEIRFRNFSTWGDLLDYSRTHSGFIIVGIAETESRKEYLQFTKPFVKIPYNIVARVSSPIQGIRDLQGKTVSTVAMYAVNDYLRENYPEIRIREVPDNLSGLRQVSTGQVDAMVVNQAYASFYIESEGLTGLRIVGKSGYMNYLSAACSKADAVLGGILEKAVAEIPEPLHQKIFRQWVYPEAGYVHISEHSYRLLVVGGMLVFMGGVGVWLLLRSLRATVRRQTLTIRKDYQKLKEAETSLRRNEQKLSAALERITFHVHNSPLAVVEWNSRGRVSDWSPRAEAIFGWRMEEVLGRRPDEWKFVHEDDLSMAWEKTEQLLKGEMSQNVCENRNYAKDGTVLYCRWYNSVMRDQENNVVSMLSQVENITESKRAEQELIRAKESAETANEAKSEFLANMSHELRTPLNGIQGMLQILQTTEMDDDQKMYVDKAIGSTRRLTSLLSDILDLSSIESGRLVLASELFDPRAVLDSIRVLFDLPAEEKKLRFSVRCHENVPETLTGDATRLRQILLNLLGNAVKFTDAHGEVWVWVEALHSANRNGITLLLIVGDTGAGMGKETVDNLLQVFAPGEVSYRRHYEGAGLGLSMVIRLVRLMDGNLCIDSEPGVGTEVGCILRLDKTISATGKKNGNEENARVVGRR
ncbi:MAG: transporter substrate-binding domain-containing protein [Desulfovibrio sp.]